LDSWKESRSFQPSNAMTNPTLLCN
jgi:hypothetical protein